MYVPEANVLVSDATTGSNRKTKDSTFPSTGRVNCDTTAHIPNFNLNFIEI
jgi:hypothetical protein